MLVLALTLAAHAEERPAPAPIPLLVDPFVGDSPARFAGGADAAWQDDANVGARASVEGAYGSRVAARVSIGLPVTGELESDLGGEARVLFTPHDVAVDGAAGVRYQKVGFDEVDHEIGAFVALGHDAGKNRFVLNGVAGLGFEDHGEIDGSQFYEGTDSGNGDGLNAPGNEAESEFELAASWSLHVGDHAAIGALAQGRWGDEHNDSTIGPTVGVETGGLSAAALVGYADARYVGPSLRTALIVQYAF